MRIMVADYQLKVRFALRTLLSRQPGVEVAGEAATAEELLAQVPKTQPDLVLLQWRLYESSPDLYMMRKYLDMLRESLESARKFVVTFDTKRKNLNIVVQPEKQNVIDLMEEPE